MRILNKPVGDRSYRLFHQRSRYRKPPLALSPMIELGAWHALESIHRTPYSSELVSLVARALLADDSNTQCLRCMSSLQLTGTLKNDKEIEARKPCSRRAIYPSSERSNVAKTESLTQEMLSSCKWHVARLHASSRHYEVQRQFYSWLPVFRRHIFGPHLRVARECHVRWHRRYVVPCQFNIE